MNTHTYTLRSGRLQRNVDNDEVSIILTDAGQGRDNGAKVIITLPGADAALLASDITDLLGIDLDKIHMMLGQVTDDEVEVER